MEGRLGWKGALPSLLHNPQGCIKLSSVEKGGKREAVKEGDQVKGIQDVGGWKRERANIKRGVVRRNRRGDIDKTRAEAYVASSSSSLLSTLCHN